MTGKSKDAGWQVGARRTFPVRIDQAWEWLTNEPWLSKWSGLTILDPDNPCVRSVTLHQVVRVRTSNSLVQLRILPAKTGTTVAFHEEHLPDQDVRDHRQSYWTRLLDDFETTIKALTR